MLPSEVQDDASLIAFLSLAARYDLDPFAGEIYAWLNPKTKKVQTHISRDGLTKKLRQSPEVAGYTAQVVYASDTFEVERLPDGKIAVSHTSTPFAKDAAPVGAYALVRGAGERPDVIVTRRIEDYSHLFRKENWRTAAQDMILARVISAVARLVTDLSGVYVPEDFSLSEEGGVTGEASARIAKETVASLKAGIVVEAAPGAGVPVEPIEVETEVVLSLDEYEVGETVDLTKIIVAETLETIVEAEPEETVQETLLERTDEDVEILSRLPDGYTVEHTGNRWYLVSGPDGFVLEGKKFRPADAIERALNDAARAAVVRGEIAYELERS